MKSLDSKMLAAILSLKSVMSIVSYDLTTGKKKLMAGKCTCSSIEVIYQLSGCRLTSGRQMRPVVFYNKTTEQSLSLVTVHACTPACIVHMCIRNLFEL